jgi:hypothetical protein
LGQFFIGKVFEAPRAVHLVIDLEERDAARTVAEEAFLRRFGFGNVQVSVFIPVAPGREEVVGRSDP